MKAEEKANELVEKMSNLYGDPFYYDWETAKEYALIAVDEILNELHQIEEYNYLAAQLITGRILYWQEVKQHIEKL